MAGRPVEGNCRNKRDLYMLLQEELNKDPALYGFYKRVSLSSAKDIMQLVLDLLSTSVRDCDLVYLNEFGTFRHRTYKPRYIKHPGTGERVLLPERDVITFSLSSNFCERSDRRLKEVVQQPLFSTRRIHKMDFDTLFEEDDEDVFFEDDDE